MSAPRASGPPVISLRDWRRRRPQRLQVGKLHWHWCWVHCDHPMCRHKAVVAIVPYVIRWGSDAWPAMLRRHGAAVNAGARR